MTDILDLPGWSVLGKTTQDGADVLEAEYREQPTACQKCGTLDQLYRHGTKPVTYLDSPIRGSPARLLAKVQRYRCRSCGETFLQPLGGIQAERRMTERCATYIQSLCLRDTFVRIAGPVVGAMSCVTSGEYGPNTKGEKKPKRGNLAQPAVWRGRHMETIDARFTLLTARNSTGTTNHHHRKDV